MPRVPYTAEKFIELMENAHDRWEKTVKAATDTEKNVEAAQTAEQAAEDAQKEAEGARDEAGVSKGAAAAEAAKAEKSAETAKQYSGKPPIIQSGTWWTWNADAQAYTDTGEPSRGEKGDKGEKGDDGDGIGDMKAAMYDPHGRAEDIFAYADKKQDKLTGTAGQVVGFDASGNAMAQPAPVTGITETQADERYLKLAGGTLTGALTLAGAPTENLHAATKAYTDGKITYGTADLEEGVSPLADGCLYVVYE